MSMDTTRPATSAPAPAPGGNLYVGPPLGRSLARLALALAATPRPADGAAPAPAGG
jgi:hypothetical protein